MWEMSFISPRSIIISEPLVPGSPAFPVFTSPSTRLSAPAISLDTILKAILAVAILVVAIGIIILVKDGWDQVPDKLARMLNFIRR